MSLRGIIIIDGIVWCVLTLALAGGVAAYYWQPEKPVIRYEPQGAWCGTGETMHVDRGVLRHECGVICWGPDGIVVADR